LPTDRSFVWRLGFPALTPHRRAGSCLTDPDHHSSGCNGTTRCLPCTTASGGSIATRLRPAPLWTGVTQVSHTLRQAGIAPTLVKRRHMQPCQSPPARIGQYCRHVCKRLQLATRERDDFRPRDPGLPLSPRRLDAHSCAPPLLGPSDRRSVRCVERTAGARLDQGTLAHSTRRPARAPARGRPRHHDS